MDARPRLAHHRSRRWARSGFRADGRFPAFEGKQRHPPMMHPGMPARPGREPRPASVAHDAVEAGMRPVPGQAGRRFPEPGAARRCRELLRAAPAGDVDELELSTGADRLVQCRVDVARLGGQVVTLLAAFFPVDTIDPPSIFSPLPSEACVKHQPPGSSPGLPWSAPVGRGQASAIKLDAGARGDGALAGARVFGGVGGDLCGRDEKAFAPRAHAGVVPGGSRWSTGRRRCRSPLAGFRHPPCGPAGRRGR